MLSFLFCAVSNPSSLSCSGICMVFVLKVVSVAFSNFGFFFPTFNFTFWKSSWCFLFLVILILCKKDIQNLKLIHYQQIHFPPKTSNFLAKATVFTLFPMHKLMPTCWDQLLSWIDPQADPAELFFWCPENTPLFLWLPFHKAVLRVKRSLKYLHLPLLHQNKLWFSGCFSLTNGPADKATFYVPDPFSWLKSSVNSFISFVHCLKTQSLPTYLFPQVNSWISSGLHWWQQHNETVRKLPLHS